MTTLWDRREALHQTRLSEALSRAPDALAQAERSLQGLGLSELGAKAAITEKMVEQAYLLGAIDLFQLFAWLSLASVIVVWLCRACLPTTRRTAPDQP